MPKLLWANAYCLLDTSSGASMAVRTMLQALQARGWEIEIVGATVFDSPTGRTRLASVWDKVEDKSTNVLNVQDGDLMHRLVKTQSTVRGQMTADEEGVWFGLYRNRLVGFQPDIVCFYGGQPLDLLTPIEGRRAGAKTVAYLPNGNYTGARWCEDVDLIFTDSQATVDFYRDQDGIGVTPVGQFIDPSRVVAGHHIRERVLFVNPSFQKGAAVVAQMALMLENERPDIQFEVVESRGSWQQVLQLVTRQLGDERDHLSNVILTQNPQDMRPVYSRARVLFAPSLWWESFGRVAAEALMNGIPAIVTNRGGLPEVVGNAGLKVDFPEELYQKPYTNIMKSGRLAPLIKKVEEFFDNEQLYSEYSRRAFEQGKRHHLDASVNRLVAAMTSIKG